MTHPPATDRPSPAQPGLRQLRWLAAGGIAVSLVVLGIKVLAWRLTGSVALYSDAVESVVNVVTAVIAAYTVTLSARPADANHPYGHSKAEYFSSVAEGVLIVIAALAILQAAWGDLLRTQPLRAPALGLAVNAVAGVINGGWAWLLFAQARKRRSPALRAEAAHLMTDVYTSAGVIAGLVLVALTGWSVLDPIIAALVALNIIWSGWALLKEGFGGLMDEVLPPADQKQVEAVIDAHMAGALEAHDLRTRRAGPTTFIDFHLVVDGALSVDASHRICDRIEDALEEAFPGSVISIHVEPHWKREHRPMALGV